MSRLAQEVPPFRRQPGAGWPIAGQVAPVGPDPDLTEAIRGLWRFLPEQSARGPGPRWLLPVMLVVLFLLAFGLVLDWRATLWTAGSLALAIFLGGGILRLLGAIEVLLRPAMGRPGSRLPLPRAPGRLPSYAVLVPLYDEAEIVPSIVAHLAALDYPADRLDLVLVLEARDLRTRQAVASLRLPAHMRQVIVPVGGPRTKPKALNYALRSVVSEYVVVFDAEDRPEPDQLRMAVKQFAGASPRLACLQACLNVYNPRAGFFTRQFSLEYSALFDGFLPALARLGYPIPLGGTSNHFRTDLLRSVGAWDPYNVTEDADLGIRLARLGLVTGMLASTTWEEAPPRRKIWLGQRRRWLKGWMQTWLVHMRRPRALAREIGLWRFVGTQLVIGGMLLSALVYPVFLVLVGGLVLAGKVELQALQWSIQSVLAVGGMLLGFLAPMLVAGLAVIRRGRSWLLWSVPLMPIYWLFVSIAGYAALAELLVRPYHWEKTRHGRAASRRASYRLRRARTAAARVPSSR